VRTALVDRLLGRLDDLESGLTYLEENNVNGTIPGDAIRIMQIEDDDMSLSPLRHGGPPSPLGFHRTCPDQAICIRTLLVQEVCLVWARRESFDPR